MIVRAVRPALLALGLFSLSSPLPVQAAEVLDRIVAVVNEAVVLDSELTAALAEAQQQIRARNLAAPPESALRAQVLERLILNRVQTQRAQQAGIRVDDRELNEVLTNIAQQNGVSLGEFAQRIRAEGQDYLAVREQVREEMVMNRLRQREVDSRVLVTDQDIDLFLASAVARDNTEYRLSHILIATPDGASADARAAARAEAEILRGRLLKGEEFAQLAIAHSDGQQALQGGDLDFRKSEDLPSLFANAAARLAPGEVSEVLETGGGFHLIKLVDSRGGAERLTVTETKAQHILLQINTLRTEEQARVQARELHERLTRGSEDFAALAAEFSDDPGSKNNGGDLGWQPPGIFVPEFQSRLDQLQPGETSSPFRTQFGWHVARVIDRRTRDTTDETRRARARQAILQRKAAEEYEVWLRRLRDEAYVEYRLKSDRDAAEPDTATS
ncbi:MAG TPA: peptidylprolyl isomerase [Nevskiaceae bacterium]|nr:peptidylprolyl isomerase [Nevskiaceae bacterium]